MDVEDHEAQILNALADVWNQFLRLPSAHPDENNDFRRGIHDLQRIIMVRPVLRGLRER